jgi:uncharacterized protein (DUF433 family)
MAAPAETEAKQQLDPHEGETYRFLERRPHPWRKELWVVGRGMTVGQLLYSMRANRLSVAESAENYDLPPEAVQEALVYYLRHKDLIEADVNEERRQIEAIATYRGPAAVP